jgi:hypothetical protein
MLCAIRSSVCAAPHFRVCHPERRRSRGEGSYVSSRPRWRRQERPRCMLRKHFPPTVYRSSTILRSLAWLRPAQDDIWQRVRTLLYVMCLKLRHIKAHPRRTRRSLIRFALMPFAEAETALPATISPMTRQIPATLRSRACELPNLSYDISITYTKTQRLTRRHNDLQAIGKVSYLGWRNAAAGAPA